MRAPPFRNAAHNPTDRAHKRKLLWDNSPAERYRSMMRRWLDWVDIRLSPMKRKRPGAKAWNFGLLNITMVLVPAYPILAITV